MITVTALADEVRNVAARNNDRKYKNPEDRPEGTFCNYWHGTEPGCIIGHAMFNLGIAGEDLARFDKPVGSRGTGIETIVAESGYIEEDDEDLLAWLSDVQYFQDMGETWGEAVERADANEALI